MKLLKTAFKTLVIYPPAFIIAIYLVAKDIRWKDVKNGELSAIAKMGTKDNVAVRLIRKGQVIPLFKPNFIGKFLNKLGLDFRNFLFGKYYNEMPLSNLVVNGAFAKFAGAQNGTGIDVKYIGMGTGTTAAAATDTTLETEINQDGNPSFTTRGAAGTQSLVTTNVTDDTAQVVRTFTIGAYTPAVTELGLFDAATSGTLYARQVFSAVNLVEDDSFQVTWKSVYSTP